MARRRNAAFTLTELLVAIVILTVLISLLLPTLSRVRSRAAAAKMAADEQRNQQRMVAEQRPFITTPPHGPDRPLAVVKSFAADIVLTPRLSVGTLDRESIYEAKFTAKIQAAGASAGESEIQLPLPPQIISLADLTVLVNGQVSESVTLRDDKLVWNGALPPSGS